jgi:hypothetical protein
MIDLKRSTSIPHKESMEIDVFLHQKNLVNESMLFLRRVESKAKQLKSVKVKLIDILIHVVG